MNSSKPLKFAGTAVKARLEHREPASEPGNTTIGSMLRALAAQEAGPIAPGYIPGSIFSTVLDLLGCPLLIVDRCQHIHYANAAAETALQTPGALSRKDQQLVIEPPNTTFANALDATTRDADPAPKSLIVSGNNGRSAVLWLQPFAASLKTSDGLWSRGLVVVAFRELQCKPRVSQGLLYKHFQLTPKEAELACHLANGEALNDIVELMQIQRSTARSHLAKCFIKTGTHRQPDLVALVLSLASPMRA